MLIYMAHDPQWIIYPAPVVMVYSYDRRASQPPRGFREDPETGQLFCPHRDVSCCPACTKTHPEIVEVGGQHFWTHSPAEKKELLQELARHSHRSGSAENEVETLLDWWVNGFEHNQTEAEVVRDLAHVLHNPTLAKHIWESFKKLPKSDQKKFTTGDEDFIRDTLEAWV